MAASSDSLEIISLNKNSPPGLWNMFSTVLTVFVMPTNIISQTILMIIASWSLIRCTVLQDPAVSDHHLLISENVLLPWSTLPHHWCKALPSNNHIPHASQVSQVSPSRLYFFVIPDQWLNAETWLMIAAR